MDISLFKKSLLLPMIGLSACVHNQVDMSKFDIHQFNEISKTCSSNSHCKVVKINSYECGGYESIVYSKLKIRGGNETSLLKLAAERVESDQIEMEKSLLEVCTLVAPKPTKGVCWKNGCEKIRTWR